MKEYNQESIEQIRSMNKLPSIKDEIDWNKFCYINDPSGMVMFHIPYNYFHVWRVTGIQDAYQAIKDFMNSKEPEKGTLDDFLKRKFKENEIC